MAARRQRYDDTRSVGPSQLVPFIPGEDAGARHERRKTSNLQASSELETKCQDAGVTLAIKNEGHHWIFQYNGKVAEWWPSSAKMVFDKQWGKGIHVHDHLQAWNLLVSRWNLAIYIYLVREADGHHSKIGPYPTSEAALNHLETGILPKDGWRVERLPYQKPER